MDPFLSSVEGGGETPTQLGPLESANLNHWMSVLGPVTEVSYYLFEVFMEIHAVIFWVLNTVRIQETKIWI
jgi:hypothetical protein